MKAQAVISPQKKPSSSNEHERPKIINGAAGGGMFG